MNRDKLLICFNHSTLGGAERSMLYQACIFEGEFDLDFLVPKISGGQDHLTPSIEKLFPNARILYFNYPKRLFRISRQISSLLNFVSLPFTLLKIFFQIRVLNFSQYQMVWANGNKIALPIMLWLTLVRYKEGFIWHHRDYFSFYPRLFEGLIRIFVRRVAAFKLYFVANSLSVKHDLEKKFKKAIDNFFLLYNPSGLDFSKDFYPKSNYQIKKIGVMSMMAPWKGIHQVSLMAKIYQNELKALGVEKIYIYGDNIYHTSGDHQSYSSQLAKLSKVDLIEFRGNVKPSDAFHEFDLLIHSSIRPEPFGKVILEAFLSQVLVVGTGMGGASEMLKHKKTGLEYCPYDYHGLFEMIKLSINDQNMTKNLVKNAFFAGSQIEKSILSQVDHIFTDTLNKKIIRSNGGIYGKSSACI